MGWKQSTGSNRRIRRSFMTRGTGEVVGWINGCYCGWLRKEVRGSVARLRYYDEQHSRRAKLFWESEKGVLRSLELFEF